MNTNGAKSTQQQKKRNQKKKAKRQMAQKAAVPRTPAAKSRPPAAQRPASINRYIRQAEQFLDPGRFGSSVLIPDRSGKVRCTRKFTKTLTLSSANAGQTDGFTVVVRPDLNLPYATSGPSTLLPAAPGGLTIKGHIRISSQGSNNVNGTSYHGYGADNSSALGQLKWDGNVWCFQSLVTNGGVAADATVTISALYEMLGHVNVWTKVAGVWVKRYDGNFPVRALAVNIGNLANQDVGFTFTNLAVGETTLKFIIVVSGTATGQLNNTQVTDLPVGDFVRELGDTVIGGRLTGMSLLVTNTSPELANGGTVYAARVPRDVPYSTSPASMLGKCPLMYQGAAAKGAYVWWYPVEETCQSYLDLEDAARQYANDNYLWVNLSGWGGANVSTAHVTITWCLEFYAESQMYEKIVPPPRTQEWDEVMTVLARLPEASCNPLHGELFKEFVRNAKDMFGRAASHYAGNKRLYDSLISSLLSMA